MNSHKAVVSEHTMQSTHLRHLESVLLYSPANMSSTQEWGLGMEKDAPALRWERFSDVVLRSMEEIFSSAVDFWCSVQSSSENDTKEALFL